MTRSGPTPVNGYTWLVTFLSSAGKHQPLLNGDVGAFQNSGSSSNVAHHLYGKTSDDATISINHVSASSTSAIGGGYGAINTSSNATFTLSFRGAVTKPIKFNAEAGEVENALEALPTLGLEDGYADVSVSRTNLPNLDQITNGRSHFTQSAPLE